MSSLAGLDLRIRSPAIDAVEPAICSSGSTIKPLPDGGRYAISCPCSTRHVIAMSNYAHEGLWSWHQHGFDPQVEAFGSQGAGGRLSALRIDAPAGEYPILATQDFTFQLDLSGGSSIDIEVEGVGLSYEGRRGTVFAWPPGTSGMVRRRTCSSVLAVAVAEQDIAFGSDGVIDVVARPIFHPRLAQNLAGIWQRLPDLASDKLAEDVLITSLCATIGAYSTRQQTPARLTRCRLKRSLDLIDEKWTDALTLDELASAVGMSKTHFLRAFRNATGLPPHQFILRRRLDEAANLLAVTDRPISEVALLCGFASHAHLTSMFGRARRVTPQQWRIEARG